MDVNGFYGHSASVGIQSTPSTSAVSVQTDPVLIIDQSVVVQMGSSTEKVVHPEAFPLLSQRPVAISWSSRKVNQDPVVKKSVPSPEYKLRKNKHQQILRRISPRWRNILKGPITLKPPIIFRTISLKYDLS